MCLLSRYIRIFNKKQIQKDESKKNHLYFVSNFYNFHNVHIKTLILLQYAMTSSVILDKKMEKSYYKNV